MREGNGPRLSSFKIRSQMRSPPPEKNKRAMKNSALFAFLWLQSSLNFRRLLRVVLSPSVTKGVKNVSNIVEVRLAREMIGHMCHFYMRCQTPFATKELLHQSVRGLISLKD